LEEREQETLVEVTIFTGRPHQIRIHMAAMGHPLIGDPLYKAGGVPEVEPKERDDAGSYGDATMSLPGDCGYHLHHMELSFCHPAAQTTKTISARPPDCLCTQEELAEAGVKVI